MEDGNLEGILNALGVTAVLAVMIAWAIWPDLLDTLLVAGFVLVVLPWVAFKTFRDRRRR